MPQADELTITPNIKTPATDHKYLDFEAPIRDVYSASLALTDWAENNLAGPEERDELQMHVFRLNDEQVKVMFYLMYAVEGHARELSKLFHTSHEVQS